MTPRPFLIAALAFLAAPAAQAATVTVSTDLAAVSNYDTFLRPVSLPGFDAALGTLNAVTARLELTLVSVGSVFADVFGGDVQFAIVNTGGAANVQLDDGTLLMTSHDVADTLFLSPFGPNLALLTETEVAEARLLNLAAVTGRPVTGTFFGGLTTTVIGGADAMAGAAFLNELTGRFSLTYDYTPAGGPVTPPVAPVPLPAGLPLLLGAAVPLGLLHRRSRGGAARAGQ